MSKFEEQRIVEEAFFVNYTLIEGKNDRELDMLKLIALFAGTGLHVKLSRYNEVEGVDLKPSENARLFLNHLKAAGISCEYDFNADFKPKKGTTS